MVIKKCVVCGKEFDARRAAKTCSKECSKEHDKECRRQRARKWHKEHPTIKKCIICGKEFNARGKTKTCSNKCSEKRRKEKKRQWEKDNKECLNERKKKWRQNNKEYMKEYGRQWHQNNKEHVKKYKNQWRQDNKEHIKKYRNQWCQNNKEKVSEYQKRHYRKNKDNIIIKKNIAFKKKIDVLIKQYDGDLEKILKNIPSPWQLREAQMRVWFNESYYDGIIAKIKSTPYCEVTGEVDNLVVHHLYGFNTHPELGNDPTNMVRITEKVHKAFHKEYGYGNNTPQQWEEFVNNYLHNSASSNQSSSSLME